MGTYRIGVLLGDDIGPEIVPQAVGVLAAEAETAPDLKLEFVELPIGKAAYEATGYSLPPGTLEKLAQLHGWILGPIGHAAYPKDNPNFINPHPILRRHFDLYANMRPALSIPGIKALHEGVDVLIVRENNEGMQPDRNMYKGSGEFMPMPDIALSTRVITERGSERIARAACEAARNRGKRQVADGKPLVTIVHKRTGCRLSRRGR
jgi:3-isopropylmalate dehydrogenase